MPQELIDVRELMQKYSLRELNEAADRYFAKANPASLLRKPFQDLGEAAEVTLTFLHVLKVLAQPRGATILDFGCGTAWTSAIMAGLGYRVIATDVSTTALEIARAGYPDREITYLLFDGIRIDLPDRSVDAITCLSALHHVPNLDKVLAELGRVLKPWGVAGFSEPGPNHSLTPQSQSEMREFTVIENDIHIDQIWEVAQCVGFTNIELNLFQPEPILTTLDGFNRFLAGDRNPAYEEAMRSLMIGRRLFFLEKGVPGLTTSLSVTDLDAELTPVRMRRSTDAWHLTIGARNTGRALWRPSEWFSGPVRLGATVVEADGTEHPHPRVFLPKTNRYGILPGQEVMIELTIPATDRSGNRNIRLQLVSEFVSWFGRPLVIALERL
jgi:SAM-dependent methyltransferase